METTYEIRKIYWSETKSIWKICKKTPRKMWKKYGTPTKNM
jgi:hypothetical protein